MASAFAERFGEPGAVVASAPGRVNLIGEHTDYNDGWVLPLAIPQRTVVQLAVGDGATVRVASAAFDADVECFTLGQERPRGDWLDYVQGATVVLRAAGLPVGCFDALVRSTVPVGAGLSSSAALTVALLRALRHGFGWPLDDIGLARLAQRVETDFVGAQVGIMDQMAVSFASTEEALLLDCRSLDTTLVPLPPTMALVVIDSGVRHAHAAGSYNQRRAECAAACEQLGVESLRELAAEAPGALDRLPEPLGRRVRHVRSENQRVHDTVTALRAGDVEAVGRVCAASHASLRDDFEVSVPAVDRLVEVAMEHPAVCGARMTGGGFGGAVVVVTRGEGARAAGEAICQRYGAMGRVVAVVGVS